MNKFLLSGLTLFLSTQAFAQSTAKPAAWQDESNLVVIFTPNIIKAATPADFAVTANGTPIAVSAISKLETTNDGSSITLRLTTPLHVNANNQVNFKPFAQSTISIYPRKILDQPEYYSSEPLGLRYSPSASSFALWAPTAAKVQLYLYSSANFDPSLPDAKINLQPAVNGVWHTKSRGDLAGHYYLYAVTLYEDGKEITNLVADPYSNASAPNSAKSYIYSESAVDARVPAWSQDHFVTLHNNVDAIIDELHIRDYTIDKSSGVASDKLGKFLGLAQQNTHSAANLATGLANLQELGVTHVQLMPVYDYGTGDETSQSSIYPWYNWGYDPVLYNNVEGSYASTPLGTARQQELKTLISTLHQKHLGVIKDVVFNHTFQTGQEPFSIFDKIVPYYYYRVSDNGVYSNGSYCGNELASEKPMVRRFIVDSVVHDVTDYHFDGFRFDLMSLIDTQTMLAIRDAVKKINPNAILIGEGWSMPSTYPSQQLFSQVNVQKSGIAAFNDGMRDNLRGDVFQSDAGGFIQGKPPYNSAERLSQLIKGAVTGRDKAPIPVASPNETVNYVACHDNATLIDKINSAAPAASKEQKLSMDALAFGVIMTSQGIPFLEEGQEFARSKLGNDNSYNNNDPRINPLNWNLKHDNRQLFEFYRFMIALRKNHPAFRMTSAAMIQQKISFLQVESNQIIFQINDHANQDQWKTIRVLLNGTGSTLQHSLSGNWHVVVNGMQTSVHAAPLSNKLVVPAYSMAVLYQD